MIAKNNATLTLTLPSDREIVMTRVFDAPRRLVFEAYTNPEHLPHWMLGPEGWTMPVCEIDLRPAGHGTSSGAVPTEARWGCVACIRRSFRLSGSSPPSRGGRLARNDQHADPLRGGRQDDDHDGSLPIEGGSRLSAQDGDEGRRVREL